MARILVIDDDEQILRTLHQVLEMEGHEVLDASNGKEGIETMKELGENEPEVKILAISGGCSVDPHVYLHLAEKPGAMRTLVKPFSRDELLNGVKEIFE